MNCYYGGGGIDLFFGDVGGVRPVIKISKSL